MARTDRLAVVVGPAARHGTAGRRRVHQRGADVWRVSGLNGTSAGVGEALSPLIGVWAPTFSACELAAVFLLPFVAIRLVAGDRQSGALKLELQQGMSTFARITAKAMVLLAGWMIAMLPPLSAILLWKSYGGTVYPPELITLAVGHLLNAGLTIGLAAAMSSFTEHPSTAAILTLSVTVGTWILSFFGAIEGGWWERAAGYTPAAMVAEFQHGLLRLDTTLVAVVLILTGLGVSAVWMRLGDPVNRRIYQSIALCVVAAAGIAACTRLRPNWDLSESRSNSFPEADELALRRIHGRSPSGAPAPITAARPGASRAFKLRRVMPDVQVRYVSAPHRLFEQTREGRRDLVQQAVESDEPHGDGRGRAGRDLRAGRRTPPAGTRRKVFRGHPLAVPPTGAGPFSPHGRG